MSIISNLVGASAEREITRRTALGTIGGVAVVAGSTDARAAQSGALRAVEPRVEWLSEPIGIDALQPRFSWKVAADGRDVVQAGARVLVATSRRDLRQGRADIWDSGAVRSARAALAPPQPLKLASHTRYFWSVTITDGQGRRGVVESSFVTGIVGDTGWAAKWIAARADPVRTPHIRGQDRSPAPADTVLPIFRRDFTVGRGVRSAIVSVAGLGQYELRINGKPVTASMLNPGWTNYAKTILYDSFDVTDLLRGGDNALGVMLGNGMYNVERKAGRYTKFVDSFGAPKLILQLDIIHDDSSRSQIVSDENWSWLPGPIIFSSIYGGEDVDARRWQEGWDRAGHRGPGWKPALLTGSAGGQLMAQGVPPVVAAEALRPVAVTRPAPGVTVHDFGQNFAGRPELVVRGGAGSTVRLTPGEALADNGTVSQRSYNAKPGNAVYFEYTLAGTGDESFAPRFSYQGFRYLQVESVGAPTVVRISASFIHAGLDRVGDFASSNALFVATHRLIDQAVRSNAFSVLTDCPHREKLGWLEQTYLNAATILYNRDAVTLYEKMARDIADAQQADGMVPGIAPEYIAFIDAQGGDQIWRNSPEWGIAAVLAPWAIYRAYGDTAILARGYPAMRRYVDYLGTRAVDGIIDFGMGDWYDIGPKDPGPSQLTSRALTGTAVHFEALGALVRIATILGQPGDAAMYAARAAAVGRAFEHRFLDAATGRYDTGSQTACAMPLALGLVPEARRPAVLAALVAAIRGSGNGVTAGDVGFHYVVRALSDAGRHDVLFDMMSVTDRPSYGYQIAHGATALAEAWDANPTKSLNHFMLGHGEGWLFGSLGGVKVDFAATDPSRIVTIAPQLVGDVTTVAVSYESVMGRIACRWERRAGVLTVEAEVPPGPGATVRLPVARADLVRERGRPLAGLAGIRTITPVPGGVEILVGSGRYRFAMPA